MSTALHKKSILKKTGEVAGSTMLSRFLGVARDLLITRLVGAGAMLDAFISAYKIPNSMRKVFAEGALSASFIPTLVKMKKKGQEDQINRLMTLSFIVIEGILITICLLMFWKADWLFRLIVPGWYTTTQAASFLGIPIPAAWTGLGEPAARVYYAITFFRILISFIVFISCSALLAGALQAVNHFFVPAISPVLLNVVFISGLGVMWLFGLSLNWLCFFIVLGGVLQFLLHLFVYFHFGFSFKRVNEETWLYFKEVIRKFFPCFFSLSVNEIALFIDTSFASYLPEGSVSLIYLANRFMGIPMGVFAAAFSTILLPHFSRIGIYAPKRLSFYLLEVSKFVLWIMLPTTIILSFLSEKIFHTLFLSSKFTLAQVDQARWILIAYLLGLSFFALNKILLNLYYAMHNTRTPAIIALTGTITNIVFNMLFIERLKATGLALATSIGGMVQTTLFIFFLYWFYDFRFYAKNFFNFLVHYLVQLAVVLSALFVVYYGIEYYVITLLPHGLSQFLLFKIGFWFWVGPLCGFACFLIFYLRKIFNVKLHFLD